MDSQTPIIVGVGLRHEHYFDALENIADIDFVEVHAENFFSSGGAPRHLLQQARQHYALSIHGTSLGLGSAHAPEAAVLDKFHELCEQFNPMLVSDHACFNRASVHGKQIHTGDLLPLRFNQASLDILSAHVELVQDKLKRTLLIENLSAYIPNQAQQFTEFEFLAKLCERTGCRLLLDVNNLLVNIHNAKAMGELDSTADPEITVLNSLQWLSPEMVGEYHLAGCTTANDDTIMIDDHARPVSELCWSLFEKVVSNFGRKPTLIEWDQNLPSWQELTDLALRARAIQECLNHAK